MGRYILCIIHVYIMAEPITSSIAISFVISLLVSTVVIYLTTKFFGEREGIGTAVLAAIIGTAIYSLAYAFTGIFASIIGGIVWLLALQRLYRIGWIRSLLIAVVIWIIAAIVSLILPTLRGPL